MMQFPSVRKFFQLVAVFCGVLVLGQQSVIGADTDDLVVEDSITQDAYGISSSFGKWLVNQVPYVYNSTNAPADWSVAEMEAIFADSIAEWEGYCNITFDYQGVNNTAGLTDTSDNIVAFGWDNLCLVEAEAPTCQPSGRAAGRAGPAWTTASETSWGHWLYLDGSMRLDLSVFASGGTTEAEIIRAETNIRETTTHELGHLIGLGHSDQPYSIMHANPYNSISHTVQDDIDACRSMYGYSTVYRPPATYTPPAAGTNTYDLLWLSTYLGSDPANSTFWPNDMGPTDDLTALDEEILFLRYQNTTGGYSDDLVHVVVDPWGRVSTAAQLAVTGGTGGGYGIARMSQLREVPGTWTVYVYDSTGLLTSIPLTVPDVVPASLNEPPTATVTYTEDPSNRSISATTTVTGDNEGDNATIVWHIPSVGIVTVPLNASAGSNTQNFQLLDAFDWDLHVDVRDDGTRYADAGGGFHNLFHYFASSLLQGPDYDGDNSSDVLWRNTNTGQNWVHGVNGNLVTDSAGINTVSPANWSIDGTGDYNGDGRSDILWRNSSTLQLWMYLMNGSTIETSAGINMGARTHQPMDRLIVGNGDYDGDGNSDILWRDTTTGFNWIYFMNGPVIANALGINIINTPGWNIVGSGDFDGDRDDDILWRNSITGQNWMYLTSGATIDTSAGVNTVPSQDWQVAGIADFNGDTYEDILWRNSTTGQNWIYFMQGNTIIGSLGVNTVPSQDWQVAGVGDYNADSYADIYWRNSSTGQNWIYFMIGNTITDSAGVNTVGTTGWEVVNHN
jgi:hypothetical protein